MVSLEEGERKDYPKHPCPSCGGITYEFNGDGLSCAKCGYFPELEGTVSKMAKQVSMKLYTFDVVFTAQFGGKFYKESDETATKHPGKRYWIKKKEGEWWLCK